MNSESSPFYRIPAVTVELCHYGGNSKELVTKHDEQLAARKQALIDLFTELFPAPTSVGFSHDKWNIYPWIALPGYRVNIDETNHGYLRLTVRWSFHRSNSTIRKIKLVREGQGDLLDKLKLNKAVSDIMAQWEEKAQREKAARTTEERRKTAAAEQFAITRLQLSLDGVRFDEVEEKELLPTQGDILLTDNAHGPRIHVAGNTCYLLLAKHPFDDAHQIPLNTVHEFIELFKRAEQWLKQEIAAKADAEGQSSAK
jgi:hypothetical protein